MFKKFKCKIPMDIQFFAEPASGDGGSAGTGEDGTGQQTQPQGTGAQSAAEPQIDYNKIQSMLEGTLAAKEETALKAYFKQQGLSQQEVEQAIAAFKQQKASQQPDVNALQAQAAQAQTLAQQAQIRAEATMAAVGLGIDAKTIPYVLKMADLSQVMGQDGKINDETLENALNKVLEDIPALKPAPAGQTGFVQVGASEQQQTSQNDQLASIFGNKK